MKAFGRVEEGRGRRRIVNNDDQVECEAGYG